MVRAKENRGVVAGTVLEAVAIVAVLAGVVGVLVVVATGYLRMRRSSRRGTAATMQQSDEDLREKGHDLTKCRVNIRTFENGKDKITMRRADANDILGAMARANRDELRIMAAEPFRLHVENETDGTWNREDAVHALDSEKPTLKFYRKSAALQNSNDTVTLYFADKKKNEGKKERSVYIPSNLLVTVCL